MQAITHTERERERESERGRENCRVFREREKYCIDTETVIHRKIETLKERERERERERFYKKVLCIETYKKKEREREWQRVKIQGELQHQGQQ